ncbi:MAG: response regulator [Leptospirales bacterium]|nr:response regulator [Leptospirales bacterium]
MKTIFDCLIVEDDPLTQQLVEETLHRYNFHVTIAKDGHVGQNQIRNHPYDVILCDIMLPYADGFQVLEKARNLVEKTPIIMLTALSDKNNVVRAGQAGATAYLAKPFTNIQLIDKVSTSLGLTAAQLFDKKQYPFEVHVSTPDSHTMILQLSGCPLKNPVKVVFERASQYLAAAPKLNQICVEVSLEMAYEFRTTQYLEEIVSIIVHNSKVREDAFVFSGAFFKQTDPERIVAFCKRFKVDMD